MTQMDDLVTWLGHQLDDDERVARAAVATAPESEGRWECGGSRVDHVTGHLVAGFEACWDGGVEMDEANAEHIARWDPARVLAEVEGQRARVAVLANILNDPPPFAGLAESFLKLEARPYAGQPGWREEWRLA